MVADKPVEPRSLPPSTLVFCEKCSCHYLTACNEHGVAFLVELKTLESGGSIGFKR